MSTPSTIRNINLHPDIVEKIVAQVKEDEIVAMSRDFATATIAGTSCALAVVWRGSSATKSPGRTLKNRAPTSSDAGGEQGVAGT